MAEIRVQILLSFGVNNRNARFANTQLLSGDIEQDAESMEMMSEAVGDRWRVHTVTVFLDPPSPKREECWDKGERMLWFVPHGELRNLSDGEIFVVCEPRGD